MARAGETAQAEKLANGLAERFPLDTLLNSYWLPVIRASMEVQHRNAERGLQILEGARRYELASPDTWPGLSAPIYPIYLRGECLILDRQAGEAAKEFQKLLEHRGQRRASPMGPRAQVGSARTYAVGGDAARAKAAYQGFFVSWKGADEGIPLMAEAKAEFKKLE